MAQCLFTERPQALLQELGFQLCWSGQKPVLHLIEHVSLKEWTGHGQIHNMAEQRTREVGRQRLWVSRKDMAARGPRRHSPGLQPICWVGETCGTPGLLWSGRTRRSRSLSVDKSGVVSYKETGASALSSRAVDGSRHRQEVPGGLAEETRGPHSQRRTEERTRKKGCGQGNNQLG